jgi:hypothetical protein
MSEKFSFLKRFTFMTWLCLLAAAVLFFVGGTSFEFIYTRHAAGSIILAGSVALLAAVLSQRNRP